MHMQPAKLMESIISCAQLEDAVEEERQLLSSVEVDVEDVESFRHQLKGFYESVLFECPFYFIKGNLSSRYLQMCLVSNLNSFIGFLSNLSKCSWVLVR